MQRDGLKPDGHLCTCPNIVMPLKKEGCFKTFSDMGTGVLQRCNYVLKTA